MGKILTKMNEIAVDFSTVARHKLYPPKSVEALYISKGFILNHLFTGQVMKAGSAQGQRISYLMWLLVKRERLQKSY